MSGSPSPEEIDQLPDIRPAKSLEQQRVEGYFTWAFARALAVARAKREDLAVASVNMMRRGTQTGAIVGAVRHLNRVAANLARSGVQASLIVRPGELGLSIPVFGIIRECFTPRELDDALSVLAQ